MLVKQPKYRRQISKNQEQLLYLLYKFRFVTLDLLADYIGKNRSTIYESLFVLEEQGYVSKRYDSSYKIRQRPASYTLSKTGIQYLMGIEGYNLTYLRASYKNRTFKEEAIDKHLNVFTVALALRHRFDTNYQIFTKPELTQKEFITPAPDLFVHTSSSKPDYVVDIVEAGTLSWLLKRRISQYMEFDDENDYQSPHVLFIAGNKSTEKRLFRFTYENYKDFEFYITQQELLTSKETRIWTDPDESDEDEIVRISFLKPYRIEH